MENKVEKTSKNKGLNKEFLENQWKKGESGNIFGRPKGTKNWSTVYWEALEKLADKNDTTPEELNLEILQKGILLARKGDFRFFKDIQDREYGSATQNIKHEGDIEIHGAKEMTKKIDEILNEDENISNNLETKESNKGNSE